MTGPAQSAGERTVSDDDRAMVRQMPRAAGAGADHVVAMPFDPDSLVGEILGAS